MAGTKIYVDQQKNLENNLSLWEAYIAQTSLIVNTFSSTVENLLQQIDSLQNSVDAILLQLQHEDDPYISLSVTEIKIAKPLYNKEVEQQICIYATPDSTIDVSADKAMTGVYIDDIEINKGIITSFTSDFGGTYKTIKFLNPDPLKNAKLTFKVRLSPEEPEVSVSISISVLNYTPSGSIGVKYVSGSIGVRR